MLFRSFGKKKKTPQGPESGAGRAGRSASRNTGRSYEDLPSDAKSACDKYVKQKLMTRDEYLQAYDWE